MKTAVFTKSFQDWPLDKVCEAFASLGVDGLDLTVRPGGHIEPADAPTRLPEAARIAHEHGLELLLLTTAVTEANDEAERLFAACAEVGVTRIKLGYFRYQPVGTLRRQLDELRPKVEAVAKLADRFEVRPCIHVHSGTYLPSHGTLLYLMLKGFRPDEVGAYVDMLHMVYEGGGAGWQQGLDLLAPWISLVAVKNFAYEPTTRGPQGQQRWQTRTVPLADGISPIGEYVATLRKLGYDGVYSLHSEYKGGHSFRDLDTAGCLAQTAEDLKFFRRQFPESS